MANTSIQDKLAPQLRCPLSQQPRGSIEANHNIAVRKFLPGDVFLERCVAFKHDCLIVVPCSQAAKSPEFTEGPRSKILHRDPLQTAIGQFALHPSRQSRNVTPQRAARDIRYPGPKPVETA